MTGRTISHYEILEKLGAGGMGEIYKARDPRLNRIVAIKALPASAMGDPERRRRFVQEAQAASGLNHPNIIVIHDILTDSDGSDYMVMEYIAGKTLGELIPPGGLGLAKTLQYATQIADALEAAHAAGIVHRDLKPGNVMVTDAGRVKVLDFGLAKVTMATSLTDATQTLALAGGPVTVEGSILGTVSYMSPEQAQGKRVDARSDIFAFGALLYEMVTGRKAFDGDSPLVTLTAILRDEVRPVAEFAAGVPAELDDVIMRSLRKNPDERWQSMREVHAVLAALRMRFESGILDATLVLPRPSPKKGIPWALATAAFGMTIAFGGWWVALHRVRPVSHGTEPAAVAGPREALPKGDEKPSALTPNVPAVKEDGTLTNESVLAMVRAKVAEGVMVSHVRAAAKTKFDLSTPELIRLTQAGVPAAVLEAMRGAPSTVATVTTAAKPATVETKTVAVLSGLPVVLALSADVPNDAEQGLALRFAVKEDFTVGSTTVIKAGATATGEVAGVKKGILSRGGKPTFRLFSVEAVDGTKIALRAVERPGDKAERVIEPSGRKDKSVLAPAGTEYTAYIDGAQSVVVRK